MYFVLVRIIGKHTPKLLTSSPYARHFNIYHRVTCSRQLPVLDNYARESFDINRENARVFCSSGFYLRNTTSLRKKEEMAMLRIKVCMNIIFIVSDIYAHFLIPKNNSKFTGSLLKIYVCGVNKTLLSMKVKYLYVIQNRKYTGGAVHEKKYGTPFGSYLISFIFISTLFLYCVTPMEHFFKHV